jgi:Methylamine utilisation protein MauE
MAWSMTVTYIDVGGRSNRFWWIDVALLTRHFCRSLIGDHLGRPLVGAFQFAVLTWQGFLLIAAAAARVRAPRRFAMAVAGYRLAPSALVEPLACSVPGVELILGAGLISGGVGCWYGMPRISR